MSPGSGSKVLVLKAIRPFTWIRWDKNQPVPHMMLGETSNSVEIIGDRCDLLLLEVKLHEVGEG